MLGGLSGDWGNATNATMTTNGTAAATNNATGTDNQAPEVPVAEVLDTGEQTSPTTWMVSH